MPQIVSVHSFRGGTGESYIAANLAALLAAEGRRVGVIDADIQSPGIHVLFALDASEMVRSLNDYLWGTCGIKQTAYDVTPRMGPEIPGCVFLIPSSLKAGEIARVLRDGYDVRLLNDGLHTLVEELALDVLIIDTHPGLNEETLLSIAISDVLVVVLRLDQQNYHGTGVTVEVARKLEMPRMVVIVNNVPVMFDVAEVKSQVEQTYRCEVAAVLPHASEMMTLASAGIFVLRYPTHLVTDLLKHVAAMVVAEA